MLQMHTLNGMPCHVVMVIDTKDFCFDALQDDNETFRQDGDYIEGKELIYSPFNSSLSPLTPSLALLHLLFPIPFPWHSVLPHLWQGFHNEIIRDTLYTCRLAQSLYLFIVTAVALSVLALRTLYPTSLLSALKKEFMQNSGLVRR